MEAISTDRRYLPASLSWTSMFQQFKQHHERKNKQPLPARIVQWMGTQRRQYRLYGIGLKEPVGIVKHRVKKLNDLNFQWNPSLMASPEEQREHEPLAKKQRASAKRRFSNEYEQDHAANKSVEAPKYTTTSSGRRVKRRGSYASYGTATDDDEEVEAPPPPPPMKKTTKKKTALNKEKHQTISGITRSGTNKKWQVRTNHPTTNERVYLGSYTHHADALAALNAYKESNPKQTASYSAAAVKKHNKKPHKKTQAKKWKVNLNHNGKQIYIGSYSSHEEAAEALRQAKRQYSLPPKVHQQQQQQQQGRDRGRTTKGISRLKNNKWEARAPIPGLAKRRYVGVYDSEQEAVDAIEEVLRRYRDLGEDAFAKKKGGADEEDDDGVLDSPTSPSREERLRLRLERKEIPDQQDDDDIVDDDKVDDGDDMQEDAFKASVADMATPIKSNVSPATKQSVQEKKRKRLFSAEEGHVKGITQRPNGRWEARCYINGVRKFLGQYNTKEEAIEAQRDAAIDNVSSEHQEQSLAEGNDIESEGPDDNDEDTVNTADDDGTSEKNEDDDDTVNKSKTENDDDLSKGDDSTVTDGSIEPISPRTKYFPLVLYQMVNDSSESTPEILEWLPCGSAFRINDHDAIGELLGKYFRSSQYNSFHRMLNLYGFTKQSIGKYDGAFKHPQFHRDISTEDTILARVVRR